MITVGSDFSGVGAFNQALKRLGIEYNEVFACDMDKYARQTFVHNYGEPKYYPTNVYEREIPTESLDIYMTSPPCQAFSLAGKRLGKNDKRGILFFNSLEFIEKNKPRFFIFENVKGLLSDDGGRTFSEWVNFLGGKSVNGAPVLFPYADSVPYHLYWKVLNAKHHCVPQNRERVFLIGIRDDIDNNFSFPAEEHLTKRLKDVLESDVDEKYFLSEERIGTITKSERGIGFTDAELKNTANCVLTAYSKIPTDGEYLKIKSATSKGYEEATDGDSINFSVLNSETRRGRVGKGVAQTLDTACNQGTIIGYTRDSKGKVISRNIWEQAGTIHTSSGSGGNTDQFVLQNDYRIRRLTPRECFRLMDFPDTFTWPVSDSQAYKQAGNSIVVNVLYKILKNLNI
jgi:DNA (cytosine-5)-methyltransferase 1